MLLSVRHMGKKRAGSDSWLFRDLNFQIGEGEILYITGASGTGKSTLLRIMGRLETSDQGQITYHQLRPGKNFPYLLQKPVFWGNSVEEHFREILSYKANRDIKFDPDQIINDFDSLGFQGKRLLLSQPAKLSGGEAQIVALIRSIMLNPSGLLLDEPDNALDMARKLLFSKYLKNWVEEKKACLVWVSHSGRFIANSHILEMKGSDSE